ncbi:MAG TPA: aspartate aminotransferase family protein [Phycisphaerae bacterium]|nr:aspartate aminotransferase family protein [Phycisphaerae bacterium]
MTSQEVFDLYSRCVIPNYPRYAIVIVRAEGSQMWDADGKRYLDLFPGWGCSLLGYCHPRVVEAVRRQAGKLIHIDNLFYTEEGGELARLLCDHGFGGQSYFCNSGAEANEAAIKLARRHTPPGRYKIITMERGFHGRTYGSMSATAQSKTHHGYEPLVPGFVYVPYNDIDAVVKAIDDETAAILVEPIQGEGGVNIPDDGYLPALRELCDENGMLLMVDEVQTGCGRTGKWFGYQHSNIEPDIMTLAKALGGGAPIGAMVARPDVAASLKPGSHASTYGANPLVVAAAVAAFQTIAQENLLEATVRMGDYIRDKARGLQRQFGFVEEVRGRGLMIAIVLSVPGTPIVNRALEFGLRLNCTQGNILRLLPAMTITTAEVDEGFDLLAQAMKETESKLVST